MILKVLFLLLIGAKLYHLEQNRMHLSKLQYQYVINRSFYLVLNRIWFRNSAFYAINRKQYMHLSSIELTNFVIISKKFRYKI